nr:hypothetical protein [Tanacetum cinerariifolium]
MSSMGELTFFLRLQTASTSTETQKPLVKDEEAADVDVHLYRSIISSLMYLTAFRPDIMFAVYACSKFQVTPKTSHLQDVKRIFRGAYEKKLIQVLKIHTDDNVADLLTKAFDVSMFNFLCLSAKTTSWNEFSSIMASAIICLATNQKFNFSRVVTALFDNMLVPASEE